MPTRTQVVTAFGLMRVGIGAAMFVAPRALGRNDEVLMTRSFAVRELVIGVGGLRGARTDQAQTWATLGVLTDAMDCLAATIAVRKGVPFAGATLAMAAAGLAFEAYAAASSTGR
ncbi:MAG: hypothetical protein QOD98_2015 [Nocardioidaceae bacterium]|jgi:hypothetical protein|nr:hypothetical protein [Nocardioidaceae bacterium]